MNTPQPMKTYSMFEILDRTFRVYRENFWSCILLVAGVTIPISIINFILTTSSSQKLSVVANSPNPDYSNVDFGTVCLSVVISLVLAVLQIVLTSGPITYIASESFFGRKVTLMEAIQARQMRFSTLGWGIVLLFFVIVSFAIAVLIVGGFFPPFLALLGAVFYVTICTYNLIAPVLMLENGSASLGLNRAWALGKNRFWTLVGIGLVFALLTFIISLAAGTIAGLLLAQSLKTASDLTMSAFDTALSILANVFLLPLTPIAMTLLYYDTRLRLEGLESALQIVDKADARPWDIISPLPQRGLTSNDWRNLAIILVVTLLVAILAQNFLTSLMEKVVPGLPAI